MALDQPAPSLLQKCVESVCHPAFLHPASEGVVASVQFGHPSCACCAQQNFSEWEHLFRVALQLATQFEYRQQGIPFQHPGIPSPQNIEICSKFDLLAIFESGKMHSHPNHSHPDTFHKKSAAAQGYKRYQNAKTPPTVSHIQLRDGTLSRGTLSRDTIFSGG